jgi:hypothetical protein
MKLTFRVLAGSLKGWGSNLEINEGNIFRRYSILAEVDTRSEVKDWRCWSSRHGLFAEVDGGDTSFRRKLSGCRWGSVYIQLTDVFLGDATSNTGKRMLPLCQKMWIWGGGHCTTASTGLWSDMFMGSCAIEKADRTFGGA